MIGLDANAPRDSSPSPPPQMQAGREREREDLSGHSHSGRRPSVPPGSGSSEQANGASILGRRPLGHRDRVSGGGGRAGLLRGQGWDQEGVCSSRVSRVQGGRLWQTRLADTTVQNGAFALSAFLSFAVGCGGPSRPGGPSVERRVVFLPRLPRQLMWCFFLVSLLLRNPRSKREEQDINRCQGQVEVEASWLLQAPRGKDHDLFAHIPASSHLPDPMSLFCELR